MSGGALTLTVLLLRFFLQAEDGIRDGTVTGVQTWLFRSRHPAAGRGQPGPPEHGGRRRPRPRADRSEERRGGEECRSRGAPDHLKTKRKIRIRCETLRGLPPGVPRMAVAAFTS